MTGITLKSAILSAILADYRFAADTLGIKYNYQLVINLKKLYEKATVKKRICHYFRTETSVL